ncbi:MAG: GumC domain-containing protein [Thermoguttaceae bacterium]
MPTDGPAAGRYSDAILPRDDLEASWLAAVVAGGDVGLGWAPNRREVVLERMSNGNWRPETMMNDNRPTHVDPGQLLAWLWEYRWRWILPTAAMTVAAAALALLKPSQWDASQALTIRNEAANNEDGPGKFSHSEERRTAQETVLELAKSRVVLAAAMKQVGAPATRRTSRVPWPSEEEIDDFQENVTLTPPKGAELGRTEVFYLTVRDRDRRRAVELVAAVRDQLEARYQLLRDTTAKSMSVELRKVVEMARKNLAEATARVAKVEGEVGEDLGDLRMLQESISGETSLQRSANEICNELRQVRNSRHSTEALMGLLREAQKDPQRLVATPNRLIESQPGLRQLKEGLVEAQLRTASLLGQMSDIHPAVIAARESEQEVRRNIHSELAEAISGLELELRLQGEQELALQNQLNNFDSRLARLAAIRASYGSNLTEMANRADLLREAEDDLSQAEVSQAGADTVSLIGRIDVPTVGTRPAGPGRKLIVLAGAVGGLLAGLGFLLLSAPMPGGAWVTGAGAPEVVVVLEPSHRPEVAEVARSKVPVAAMRKEPAPPTQPRPIPAGESARRTSFDEDLRMPEIDFSPREASGMSLKDALQRIGSA